MSALAVIVPTTGRPELARCLTLLAEQTVASDRIMVMCDRPRRFDWCQAILEGVRKSGAEGDWRVLPRDHLGHYGHPLRNEALDLLAELQQRPAWVWSIDDDDIPTPGALDAIRLATESGDAGWYVFRMRGGEASHFNGVTIPNRGEYILTGNVGTPMIAFPAASLARFGITALLGHSEPPGYFGDLQMAVALRDELGDPGWVPTVVAEIRPAPVVLASILPA